MNNMFNRKEILTGFPFYIFITFLLGGLGIATMQTAWQAGTPGIAILSAVLIIIHIGFYWLNIKRFNNPRWWVFYYIAQTLLIVALAFMPSGVNILFSAIITIIAEALGLGGNTRRTFFTGLFYIILMTILFFVLLGPSELFKYATQITINGGFIILLMFIFNQQLEQRLKAEELAETLESANAKLAAYAARNEALALQAERERMARELHDTLAQGVAGLVLQLEALKAYQEQQNYTQVSTILAQALARARNTLSESRAAIEDLRNEDTDFKTTVEVLLSQFTNGAPAKIQLSLHLDEERPIPANIQHHARRVLHEALANSNKHAVATHTQIEIHQNAAALSLQISDNGKGFDTNKPPTQGHFGLQGLAERARLTSSQYTLTSTPGAGTTIEFIFPLIGETT